MNKKVKLIVALILNISIVVLEIFGLIFSIQQHGIGVFQFYTENSNYFALIISLMFSVVSIISLIKKSDVPRWMHLLRFMSTVCLTITFIILNGLLIPMRPYIFHEMLFEGAGIYQHLICPVVSFISFTVFENSIQLKRSALLYSLIPTLVYGITVLILNIAKVMVGPYPFFYVYEIKWYFITPWLIGVLDVALLIAVLIFALNQIGKPKDID